jgi:transcription initiation factor TFIIIB Brf1 subunit/transcription initiation factor TFIIB
MDRFELLEDLEACFHSIESGALDADYELSIDYDRCTQCQVRMVVKANNHYVCSKCGLLRENVEVADMSSITSDMSYNSMSNGLRCIGNNAYRYQTILRSQSNNDASPEIHVRNILFAYNHSVGKEGVIPKDVLLNVFEQFKHVRMEGTIYRGTILRAILAAMTYYECLRHKLLFKPSDIYKWFDVDSQTYSKGDKKVREMLDHGFLSEDIRKINAEISYIHAYASKLELSEDSIAFLSKLMEFTTEHKLLNPNAKSSTRALCVLHMFLVSIEHPIKSDAFRTLFKCNYGTIRTIALDLFHVSDQLLPLFEANNIPYAGLSNYHDKSKKNVRKRRTKHSRIEISPCE